MRRPATRTPLTSTRLEAPTPSESGIYPIGVFSDAEVLCGQDEVDETLAAFETLGAKLRRAAAGLR